MWVANETEVSVKTTKCLGQLVEDNVLRKDEQGDQILYCVDQLMETYREIAALQREHSREELTSALNPMRSKITGWEESDDIETPGELRGSIADLDDADEVEERREVASEWEHLANRIPVVRAALNEYDWAPKRDSISA
mgnify:CR=1 FL=1